MAIDWLNQPEWKGSLEWEALFLDDTFPSAGYEESLWGEWQRRVRDGEGAELARGAALQDEWERDLRGRPQGSLPDEVADSLADGAFQAIRLTNTMYAAIIVAIWSDMEHFLKRVAFTCHKALALGGAVPSYFGPLTDFFNDELAIPLSALPDHPRVDAVRILNNSFKHNTDGHYIPTAGEAHTQINQALLDAWNVLDGRYLAIGGGYVVDYARLPVRELVAACNAFCTGLLDAAGSALDARLGGAGFSGAGPRLGG